MMIAVIRLYLEQQFPHFTFEQSPDSLYVHDKTGYPEAEVCITLDDQFCFISEFDRCYNAYPLVCAVDLNDPNSLPDLGRIIVETLAFDGLFAKDRNLFERG